MLHSLAISLGHWVSKALFYNHTVTLPSLLCNQYVEGRDDTSNLKTEDVIMCRPVRAIAHVREWWREWAIVECWLARENWRHSKNILFQCHFIYHKSHITSPMLRCQCLNAANCIIKGIIYTMLQNTRGCITKLEIISYLMYECSCKRLATGEVSLTLLT
jgi:hypothetical protein